MERLARLLVPMTMAGMLVLSGCASGDPKLPRRNTGYGISFKPLAGPTSSPTSAPTVATSGFHKMQGFGHFGPIPLQTCIPVYQGVPPKDYPYKDLGPVKGAYAKQFMGGSHASNNKALEDIANNAKAMNANAVIKIQLHMGFSGNASVDGEAVVFDVMPKE